MPRVLDIKNHGSGTLNIQHGCIVERGQKEAGKVGGFEGFGQ